MWKVTCLALALVACKGTKESADRPPPSPATPGAPLAAKGAEPANAAGAVVNACSLVTPDEVSQIVGIPLKATMGTVDCSLGPRDETPNPNSVNITLDVKDSDLIPTLRDMGAKDGHDVAGLGDAAFVHGKKLMQLGVLSGGKTLMIVMMVNNEEAAAALEDKAKAIATKMLSRM